jgi:hypothetical protein
MMNKPETPTGLDQATLDQEDTMLSSLTNIAYSDPSLQKRTESGKSRFWFVVESTAEMISRKQKRMEPKAIEHIDAEVEARLMTYKQELKPALKEKISRVREFFLTEIAPLTLASSGGSIQSREVVQRLLETDVDSAIFARFDNMVNRAAVLKLANFVASYFDLPDSQIPSLLGSTQVEDPELKAMLNMLKTMPSKQDLEKMLDAKN